MNPFDYWVGANFKLKIRTVQGYVNYDKSEFDTPEAFLGGNDKDLEKIWNMQYSLREFTNPSQFKSYEDLSSKLKQVLSGSAVGKASVAAEESESSFDKAFSSKPKKETFDTADEDDDAMSYFEKLVDD